jgi:hypothetical protein
MQQENLGQSVSLWMATAAASNQSTLAEDTHADVCIVGAGIAGLTTAYLLATMKTSPPATPGDMATKKTTEKTTKTTK